MGKGGVRENATGLAWLTAMGGVLSASGKHEQGRYGMYRGTHRGVTRPRVVHWGAAVVAIAMVLALLPASLPAGASGGTVTVGNALTDRTSGPDTWSNFVIIDTNNPVNRWGYLTDWSFYAKSGRAYEKIQLKVYRPTTAGFEVIGISNLVEKDQIAPGAVNTFEFAAPILVKPGDVIGMYVSGQGVVPYTVTTAPHYEYGNLIYPALFTNNTSGPGADVGEIEQVTASGNREYSIAALGVVYFDDPTTSCPEGELFVSSQGTGAQTPIVSAPAVSGYPYRLTADGLYYAGGRFTYDIASDAEYSQDADQRLTDTWTDLVKGYESYGEGLLELKVDGAFVEWGDYNPAHVYSIEHMATGDISLQIWDVYAQNNTGGLCVKVEPLPLTSVTGGGQIISDSPDGKKSPYKVSFGGELYDIDGGLQCEWQVNLHNVADTDLDGAKFHTTRCTKLNTWKPDQQTPTPGVADGVVNFTAWGTFNGEPGYKAIFRMEDRTEPSDLDTFRITIWDAAGKVVFDTSDTAGGVFPSESDNVGTARTLLDRGNIQISFYGG